MNPRTVIYDDRPDLHAQAEVIFSAGWPEFIFHDPAADRHRDRVRAWFGALNLLLVAGATASGAEAGRGDAAGGADGTGGAEGGDGIVAGGWGVPVRWDGSPILGVAERSMTMSGAVADWERWIGLALPASGRYVIPGALAPLVLDRAADQGGLTEPNVWVRHR